MSTGSLPLSPAAVNPAAAHPTPANGTSSSNDFTLGRLFDALAAAGCAPVWKSRGLRAFCPICGGGSSGKPALFATEGDTGATVFYCHRCCTGVDKLVDTEARQAILDALGIDRTLVNGAPIPRAVSQRIAAYRAALDRAEAGGAFKGQAGGTVLRILRTAALFAEQAGSTTFRGSVRQFALDAGRGRNTTSGGLKRAAAAGWLQTAAPFGALVDRSIPGGFRSVGRGWTLAIPPAWAELENGMDDDSSRCSNHTKTVAEHSILSPGGDVARACSTGREVWRTLNELIARDEPTPAADIAAARGLNPKTVKNHLVELVKMGAARLVEPGGRGRGRAATWEAIPDRLEVLAAVGEPMRAAAAAAFESERQAYARTFDVALAAQRLQRVKLDPATGEVAVDPVTGDAVFVPPDSMPDGYIVPVRIRRKRRPVAPMVVKPAPVSRSDRLVDAALSLGGVPRGMVSA